MNLLKKFSCLIGLHSLGTYENVHYSKDDPLKVLVFARCRWCKFEGQVDSQGNLF